MRFVKIYLIGYVVFVVGVLLALWRAHILAHIEPVWIGIGLVIAAGIGIMIAVASGKPELTRE